MHFMTRINAYTNINTHQHTSTHTNTHSNNGCTTARANQMHSKCAPRVVVKQRYQTLNRIQPDCTKLYQLAPQPPLWGGYD